MLYIYVITQPNDQVIAKRLVMRVDDLVVMRCVFFDRSELVVEGKCELFFSFAGHGRNFLCYNPRNGRTNVKF